MMSFADFFLIFFCKSLSRQKVESQKFWQKKLVTIFNQKRGVDFPLQIDIQQSVAMSRYCKTFFANFYMKRSKKKLFSNSEKLG